MYEYVRWNRTGSANLHEQGKESDARLNFDTQSYDFDDLDLKMAVSRLSQRDQDILTLHLMGHKQRDIGKVCGVSRSMISKRMRVIVGDLARQLL